MRAIRPRATHTAAGNVELKAIGAKIGVDTDADRKAAAFLGKLQADCTFASAKNVYHCAFFYVQIVLHCRKCAKKIGRVRWWIARAPWAGSRA
jgi:hypothetical protein